MRNPHSAQPMDMTYWWITMDNSDALVDHSYPQYLDSWSLRAHLTTYPQALLPYKTDTQEF
jgi:hypothetical protein